jgi:hypothetical protein
MRNHLAWSRIPKVSLFRTSCWQLWDFFLFGRHSPVAQSHFDGTAGIDLRRMRHLIRRLPRLENGTGGAVRPVSAFPAPLFASLSNSRSTYCRRHRYAGPGTARQPVRPQVVTHVAGTFCHTHVSGLDPSPANTMFEHTNTRYHRSSRDACSYQEPGLTSLGMKISKDQVCLSAK